MQAWSYVIGIALLIGFVVVTYIAFVVPPIQTLNDKQIIPPTRELVLSEPKDAVDAEYVITYNSTGASLHLDESSHELYWSKDQAADPSWSVSVKHPLALYSFRYDFGTYAGYFAGRPTSQGGNNHLETGLRLSAGRFFYGTTSPDLLIGRFGAGLGVSFYPPPYIFGHAWNHLGVGFGAESDYSSGRIHAVPYLSFSTRF